MRTPVLATFAAFVLTPSLQADLWVVDQNGGTGDFDDLQAAIDAAQPNDTIVIVDGDFTAGVVVEKPLRILGAGTGSVSVGALSSCHYDPFQGMEVNCPAEIGNTGLTVRGVGAAETVFVSGLKVRGYQGWATDPDTKLLVQDCQGTVFLHGLEALGESEYESVALRIESSSLVVVSSSELVGASGTWISDPLFGGYYGYSPAHDAAEIVGSTVWFVGSTLRGGSGGADDFILPPPGENAVRAEDAVIYAAASEVRGGDGGWGSAPFYLKGSGGDAVFLDASVAKLVGGPGNKISGGAGKIDGSNWGDGIDLDAGSAAFVGPQADVSSLDADPSSVVLDIDGVSPTLVASTPLAAPGDFVTFGVDGVPGHLAVLYVGADVTAPLTAPGVDGAFVLPLDGLVTVGFAPLDTAGDAFPVQVPPLPIYVGFVAFVQAAVTDGSELRISNPTALPIL